MAESLWSTPPDQQYLNLSFESALIINYLGHSKCLVKTDIQHHRAVCWKELCSCCQWPNLLCDMPGYTTNIVPVLPVLKQTVSCISFLLPVTGYRQLLAWQLSLHIKCLCKRLMKYLIVKSHFPILYCHLKSLGNYKDHVWYDEQNTIHSHNNKADKPIGTPLLGNWNEWTSSIKTTYVTKFNNLVKNV